MRTESPFHPLVPTKVYVFNGQDLVPHYTEPGVYMAPGNVRFLQEYLRLAQAPVKELMLWSRP